MLHTEETRYRREQISGQRKEESSCCYWAITLTKSQLGTRGVWHAGHERWDVENDCFNMLATLVGGLWAMDHCLKQEVTAIVNFGSPAS